MDNRQARGPGPAADRTNSVIWPELWTAFESHRSQVCEILRNLSKGPESRLSVWGSGRTTDLDLIELIQHFSRVDLIDLDSRLTNDALFQRGFDGHPNVTATTGIDVTGLGDHWVRFQNASNEPNLQSMMEACYNVSLDLGQYDVVASTCLLSQIMQNAHESLEGSGVSASLKQEYFPRIVRAIREKHIELLLDHTVAGGSAVLITDLTSAEKLPEMLAKDCDLNRLVSMDVVEGNHFHGLNPNLILDSTRQPAIAGKLASVKISPPWIWNTVESHYLCLAFRFERK